MWCDQHCIDGQCIHRQIHNMKFYISRSGIKVMFIVKTYQVSNSHWGWPIVFEHYLPRHGAFPSRLAPFSIVVDPRFTCKSFDKTCGNIISLRRPGPYGRSRVVHLDHAKTEPVYVVFVLINVFTRRNFWPMSGKGLQLETFFRVPWERYRERTVDIIFTSDAASKPRFSRNVDHYTRPWSVVRNMSQLLCSLETIISLTQQTKSVSIPPRLFSYF